MRVTGVRVDAYEYELTRPLGDVNLPRGARRSSELAIRIDTDAGLVGVATAATQAAGPIRHLAERVIGTDPRRVRGIYDDLVRAAFKDGPYGALAAGIAALDCGLWDLKAKASGLPLWQELGAPSNRVPAYASGLDAPLDDDQLRDFYAGMRDRYGIGAGKLKVGADSERDHRRLSIMSDALSAGGRRPVLMIDANEYWNPKQAIRRIGELERDFDLLWVEEPVPRTDLAGLARVSDAVRASVATGENLTDPVQFAHLLRNSSADVLQLGVTTTGITASLRIAEMAAAFDVQVAFMNCPGRYVAHVAAALPNHLMMEVLDAGRDQAFATDISLVDGHLELGDRAGLGLEFDDERLAALTPGAGPTLGATYARSVRAGVDEGQFGSGGLP